MKLVFMGTPEFAVPSLSRLIEMGHEIQEVFTQPDRPVGRKQIVTPSPVKIFALQHGLSVQQPEKIKTAEAREKFEPIFREADAGIVAAYGRILPTWMLEAPRHGCLNVHSSLLPKYRGAAPINWAIARGERETGVTIMKMDAGLDTGPILTQRATAIGNQETAAALTLRLAEIGATLLSETLSKLDEITPITQNDLEATLAPVLKREDGEVNWEMSAQEIYNRLRGFTPFPGCYTSFNGRRLEIIGAEVGTGVPRPAEIGPGVVLDVSKEGITVACGEGTILQITEVQPEGKRAMSVRDFLNGAKIGRGDRFG
ncbi:MAG: methionyl-tRNA formyltransferase [Blastocatellia bacterium]|nr:methionyl-tRNA formyltransferase [Blastocatellia bacterium]